MHGGALLTIRLIESNNDFSGSGTRPVPLHHLESATDGECIRIATDALMRNQSPLIADDLRISTLFIPIQRHHCSARHLDGPFHISLIDEHVTSRTTPRRGPMSIFFFDPH
jgi:hypothetical protein